MKLSAEQQLMQDTIQRMFEFLSSVDSADDAREQLRTIHPEYMEFINTIDRGDENMFKKKKKTGFVNLPNQKEVVKKEQKVTKLDLAKKLYKESFDKSRPTIIGLLQSELGFSSAMASSYFYLCK
jgi:Zn-dependent oligopeptidase